MNEGEIAERFIRAAEIERAMPERVGPAPVRSLQLPYVHDWVDKLGWRKEKGDKLAPGEDPLTEERRLFWERFGLRATAAELSQLETLREWLMMVPDEGRATGSPGLVHGKGWWEEVQALVFQDRRYPS